MLKIKNKNKEREREGKKTNFTGLSLQSADKLPQFNFQPAVFSASSLLWMCVAGGMPILGVRHIDQSLWLKSSLSSVVVSRVYHFY